MGPRSKIILSSLDGRKEAHQYVVSLLQVTTARSKRLSVSSVIVWVIYLVKQLGIFRA